MVRHFHENEALPGQICPDCAHHVQIDPDTPEGQERLSHDYIMAHGELDCKNVFYRDTPTGRVVVGQCCCYSASHQ